ncbi:MAG TPA: hypothetical protein VHR15_16535 [Ktedonobacterales bacterium]|nr:hypothetical protein [Ktedonobacterales bacterium]
MSNDDLREVVLAFLTAPAFVTAQTKGPDGWVASTGGGGLDALPESVVFAKERHLPKRAAYNVRYTTRAGMRMRYTLSLAQGHDGAWLVMGGAGGSAEEPPERAPKRGHPWVNLGGGGWPRQFYTGGAIEEDNGAVARVLLRSANGVELEDTVEHGEVLFLSDNVIQAPLEVELCDGAGNLVGRHMTFNFAP